MIDGGEISAIRDTVKTVWSQVAPFHVQVSRTGWDPRRLPGVDHDRCTLQEDIVR